MPKWCGNNVTPTLCKCCSNNVTAPLCKCSNNVTAPPGKNSNNVTPANEFSRKIGVKKFKKICSNYLTPAGIVRGNDVFLYGEKVKAYLRKGARALRGESEYPNARVGYGAICVENSLPM